MFAFFGLSQDAETQTDDAIALEIVGRERPSGSQVDRANSAVSSSSADLVSPKAPPHHGHPSRPTEDFEVNRVVRFMLDSIEGGNQSEFSLPLVPMFPKKLVKICIDAALLTDHRNRRSDRRPLPPPNLIRSPSVVD